MLDHYAGSSANPELYESLRALPGIERQLRALGWAAVEAITRKQDLIKIGLAEEISNPEGTDCAWRTPVEARLALAAFMREKIEAGDLCGKPNLVNRSELDKTDWQRAALQLVENLTKQLLEPLLSGIRSPNP